MNHRAFLINSTFLIENVYFRLLFYSDCFVSLMIWNMMHGTGWKFMSAIGNHQLETGYGRDLQ